MHHLEVGVASSDPVTARVPRTLIVLLLFVPVAVLLRSSRPSATSRSSCVCTRDPTAGRTHRPRDEVLAQHLGGGIGGLLNATFGNAAELIIGVMALREGLPDLVKASLTGSIIGNVLLVFGASALVGGFAPVQRFNRTAAGLGTTMLLLSTIGLVIPAVFHWLSRGSPTRQS